MKTVYPDMKMPLLERCVAFAFLIHLGIALQDNVLMPGDAVLTGLLEVLTYEDGSCGQPIPQSIQAHEAVRWFYNQLNDRDYIPGVKLGYHAFQTCGQPSRAIHQIFNILNMYSDQQGPYLVGLLGPHRSSETQPVSRLLSSQPGGDLLPQISYSATSASLSDRSVYKNLFRVIEADDMQVKVIVKLMQTLKWNYVGLIYENDPYGKDGANALAALAEEVGICIPVFVGIEADASTLERRRNFFSLVNQLEKSRGSPVLGVVFFGQGSTAEVLFQFIDVELQLENFQLIVSESLALDQVFVRNSIGKVYPRAMGLLSPSPPYYDVELFRKYWTDLHTNQTFMLLQAQNNTWLLQYMEHITGCSFSNPMLVADVCIDKAADTIRLNDRLSMYIHYAILGAASFAKALKELHKRECINGLCESLLQLRKTDIFTTIEKMTVVTAEEFDEELPNFNVTFGFLRGEINYDSSDVLSLYDVYNLQNCGNSFCFTKVGSYLNDHFTLDGTVKSFVGGVAHTGAVQAQCQPSFACEMCTETGHYGRIFFIPGDFYIVCLIPIHNRKPNSLQCGDLRESFSVDIVEAAHYAVTTINRREGAMRNISGNATFGLILMDTCVHSFVTQERVIRLNSGMLKLSSTINSSNILNKVVGYIGPAYSSVNVRLASVMNEVKKLYISFSSTSSSLSDRQQFPYFMRVCSPDYKQANVIMELAKLMGSQYVQIIYSDEEYGIAGRDALLKAAKEREVCVAQSLPVPDTTDDREFQGYISDIRKFPYAKTLILFLLPHMFPGFLKVLNDNVDFGEFVFIGGEGWAQRDELLTHQGMANSNLRGSLTLTQKLPGNDHFEEYYQNVDIQESPNPWIQDYMEARARCYFPNSFNKQYEKKCTSTNTNEYRQTDAWVPFTINAIYGLALGFYASVTSICGTLAFCPEYTTQSLIDSVKKIRLDIYNNSKSIRIFDDNGEGSVGYTLSQIRRVGQVLEYKEVGLSSESGIRLSESLIQLKKDMNFTSVCQNEKECKRCHEQFVAQPKTSGKTENSPLATVSLAVVSGLLFLLAVSMMCFILCSRKKKNKEGIYLNVIPDPTVNSSYESGRTSVNTSGDYAVANPVPLPADNLNADGHIPSISD